MRTFKCKKAYKITMILFTVAAFVFAITTAITTFIALHKDGIQNAALAAAFGVFMLLVPAVLVWFCVISFHTKLVFFPDRFVYHTLKNEITIKAKNVRSFFYRHGVLTIFFVRDTLDSFAEKKQTDALAESAETAIAPKKDEMLYKIQIGGMGAIQGAEEIVQWFSEHIEIRVDGQALSDLIEIAVKYDFPNPNRVGAVLEKARHIAASLNIAGSIIALWVWVFPVPYRFCVFLALAVPLIVPLLLRFSNGFIRFDIKGNSIYPCICLASTACALGLSWRMLNDISIANIRRFFLYGAIFFVLYMAFFLICQKEFSVRRLGDWGSLFLYSVYLFAYSLAAVCAINCVFDVSAPADGVYRGVLFLPWYWAE